MKATIKEPEIVSSLISVLVAAIHCMKENRVPLSALHGKTYNGELHFYFICCQIPAACQPTDDKDMWQSFVTPLLYFGVSNKLIGLGGIYFIVSEKSLLMTHVQM